MTVYWKDHKFEIITWVIVGVLLVVFLAWCFCSKPRIRTPPAIPVSWPRHYPDGHDVELPPTTRAFVPAPLYSNHGLDVWMPGGTELEKRTDGYWYPKRPEEVR